MRIAREGRPQWADANNLAAIRVRSKVVHSNAHLFYEQRGYRIEKTFYTFIKRLNEY